MLDIYGRLRKFNFKDKENFDEVRQSQKPVRWRCWDYFLAAAGWAQQRSLAEPAKAGPAGERVAPS